MKLVCLKVAVALLASVSFSLGAVFPIFEEREWTSIDGRVITASFVSVENDKVNLKIAKLNKVHALDADKLSRKDNDFIQDQKDAAAKIISEHNAKVKNVRWSAYWYYANDLAVVPELGFDEIRLIHAFGLSNDLEMFGVKFTPEKIAVASDKLTANIMGSEGFAVKAKADNEWSFSQSGQYLNVRPRKIEKGSGEQTATVFTIGLGERLLFPNGRSIGVGTIGLTECILLSLDNFEPRRRR